jgi:hypothetical protein
MSRVISSRLGNRRQFSRFKSFRDDIKERKAIQSENQRISRLNRQAEEANRQQLKSQGYVFLDGVSSSPTKTFTYESEYYRRKKKGPDDIRISKKNLTYKPIEVKRNSSGRVTQIIYRQPVLVEEYYNKTDSKRTRRKDYRIEPYKVVNVLADGSQQIDNYKTKRTSKQKSGRKRKEIFQNYKADTRLVNPTNFQVQTREYTAPSYSFKLKKTRQQKLNTAKQLIKRAGQEGKISAETIVDNPNLQRQLEKKVKGDYRSDKDFTGVSKRTKTGGAGLSRSEASLVNKYESALMLRLGTKDKNTLKRTNPRLLLAYAKTFDEYATGIKKKQAPIKTAQSILDSTKFSKETKLYASMTKADLKLLKNLEKDKTLSPKKRERLIEEIKKNAKISVKSSKQGKPIKEVVKEVPVRILTPNEFLYLVSLKNQEDFNKRLRRIGLDRGITYKNPLTGSKITTKYDTKTNTYIVIETSKNGRIITTKREKKWTSPLIKILEAKYDLPKFYNSTINKIVKGYNKSETKQLWKVLLSDKKFNTKIKKSIDYYIRANKAGLRVALGLAKATPKVLGELLQVNGFVKLINEIYNSMAVEVSNFPVTRIVENQVNNMRIAFMQTALRKLLNPKSKERVTISPKLVSPGKQNIFKDKEVQGALFLLGITLAGGLGSQLTTKGLTLAKTGSVAGRALLGTGKFITKGLGAGFEIIGGLYATQAGIRFIKQPTSENFVRMIVFGPSTYRALRNTKKLFSPKFRPSYKNVSTTIKDLNALLKLNTANKQRIRLEITQAKLLKNTKEVKLLQKQLTKVDYVEKGLQEKIRFLSKISKDEKVLKTQDFSDIVSSKDILKHNKKLIEIFHVSGIDKAEKLFGNQLKLLAKSEKELTPFLKGKALSNFRTKDIGVQVKTQKDLVDASKQIKNNSLKNIPLKNKLDKIIVDWMIKEKVGLGGGQAINLSVKRRFRRATTDIDAKTFNPLSKLKKLKNKLNKETKGVYQFDTRKGGHKGTHVLYSKLSPNNPIIELTDIKSITGLPLKNLFYVRNKQGLLIESKYASIWGKVDGLTKKQRWFKKGEKDVKDILNIFEGKIKARELIKTFKSPKNVLTALSSLKLGGIGKERMAFFRRTGSIEDHMFWAINQAFSGYGKTGVGSKPFLKYLLDYYLGKNRYSIIKAKVKLQFPKKYQLRINKAAKGLLTRKQQDKLRKELVEYVNKNPNKVFPGTKTTAGGIGESEVVISTANQFKIGSQLKKGNVKQYTYDNDLNALIDIVEVSIGKAKAPVQKGLLTQIKEAYKGNVLQQLRFRMNPQDAQTSRSTLKFFSKVKVGDKRKVPKLVRILKNHKNRIITVVTKEINSLLIKISKSKTSKIINKYLSKIKPLKKILDKLKPKNKLKGKIKKAELSSKKKAKLKEVKSKIKKKTKEIKKLKKKKTITKRRKIPIRKRLALIQRRKAKNKKRKSISKRRLEVTRRATKKRREAKRKQKRRALSRRVSTRRTTRRTTTRRTTRRTTTRRAPRRTTRRTTTRRTPRRTTRRTTTRRAPRRTNKTKTPPKVPPLPTLKTKYPFKKADVFIKRPGRKARYTRINSGYLTPKQAEKLGAYVVDNTQYASYVVRRSTSKNRQKFNIGTAAKKFRAPKRNSKLPANARVEKRKYRLDTRGEKRNIKPKNIKRLKSQKKIRRLLTPTGSRKSRKR